MTTRLVTSGRLETREVPTAPVGSGYQQPRLPKPEEFKIHGCSFSWEFA